MLLCVLARRRGPAASNVARWWVGNVRCAAVAVSQVNVKGGRAPDAAQRLFDELKMKFGYMGTVDHSKVGTPDLFRILKVARNAGDFNWALQAMNLFYNFGVKLKHREIASRLVAAAMVCKVESEAAEIVKLYGTWLERPPDIALVYGVMGHYLDAGELLVVRELAQAVREDWRMPVEPPLYALSIEAMLRLTENAVPEALQLHQDARAVGVRLPAALHTRLLDAALATVQDEVAGDTQAADEGAEGAGEEGEGAESSAGEDEDVGASISDAVLQHLKASLEVADGLLRDGHLLGGGSAASLCSTAWLFWHLAALPEAARAELLDGADPACVVAFMNRDWSRVLRAAIEDFGCHWGFSGQLPRGFFQALEASSDPKVAELVSLSRQRFGRFYPEM
mmetsp:Transcript_16744/g.58449  ORF Transcript_16744/g.58449 Transcript_16744/m.58449 type:complete len:395 (-) Transcript_16744:46-1230(-)